MKPAERVQPTVGSDSGVAIDWDVVADSLGSWQRVPAKLERAALDRRLGTGLTRALARLDFGPTEFGSSVESLAAWCAAT